MAVWAKKPFDRLTVLDNQQLWVFDGDGACLGSIRGFARKEVWVVSAFVDGQLQDVGKVSGRTQALGYLAHQGWRNDRWHDDTKADLKRMSEEGSANLYYKRKAK